MNETTGVAQLAKGETLPECSESDEGEMLFAADLGAAYICTGKAWTPLHGASSADTVVLKDSLIFRDTLIIRDTLVGLNGESCTAEMLDDGSGYKIVCGNDSIGVILHGTKGDSGAPGANAENCTLSDDGNGSVKVICATRTRSRFTRRCAKRRETSSSPQPFRPQRKRKAQNVNLAKKVRTISELCDFISAETNFWGIVAGMLCKK